MTDKQNEKQMRFFATANQRLKVLNTCPQLLAEDLLMIFGQIKTDEDKGVHNHLVAKLMEFCPDLDSMLLNVARAILSTINKTEN